MKKNPSAYWQQTLRLTMSLLLSWVLLSFGILFFARELNTVILFGWPLSFYMAAQGLTLVYVVLLAIFSIRSHHIAQRQKNLAALTSGIVTHE